MNDYLQPFPAKFASPNGDADLFVAQSGKLDSRDANHMHRHDFYELVWLHEGACTFFSDFQHYPLQTGTLIFISPGQLHAYIVPKDFCRILIFGFRTNVLTAIAPNLRQALPFDDVSRDPVISIPVEHSPVYERLFKSALSRFDARVPGWEPIATAYLQTVLTEATFQLSPIAQPGNVNAAAQLAYSFQQAMEQYYVDVRQVSAYADRLGVTTNHLVKTVRTVTGETPKQMLQKRLLLESKRLLAHSDASVGEIGQRLQFKDDTTFSRWFRNLTQLTPTQFRMKSPIA